MLFPDPGAIEKLAHRLDDHADDLDLRRRGFMASVQAVHWHSDGAQRYRSKCSALDRDLDSNCSSLRGSADDLRKHAAAVQARIAWMHELFDRFKSEAESAWNAVEHAPGEVFDWGKNEISHAWDAVTSCL